MIHSVIGACLFFHTSYSSHIAYLNRIAFCVYDALVLQEQIGFGKNPRIIKDLKVCVLNFID